MNISKLAQAGHDVAGLGARKSSLHRFGQGFAKHQIHAAAVQIRRNFRRVHANQEHRARFFAQHVAQRREILPLAHAAGNQPDFFGQPGNRGHRGTDIRALAVVNKGDAVFFAHFFHAVRQAFERFHMSQQAFARQADAFAQCQCRQHVRHIVAALQRNVGLRHQQRFLMVQAACARLPVIILRLLQRKIMHRAPVPFHGAAKCIVRI